jgi:uncharacterized protein
MADAHPPADDAAALALDRLLAAVPAPLEAMDASMADGYLCGVLLQLKPVAAARWLPAIVDMGGRPLPRGFDARPLHEALAKRHAELDAAIAARRWFDPWIFAVDEDDDDGGADVSAVEPWVAGFAAAMEVFPALFERDDAALTHAFALIFRHVDAAELEDADALLAEIDELEPPADLPTAVEELVRAVLLLADVSRPVAAARPAAPPRRPPPRRPAARGPRR